MNVLRGSRSQALLSLTTLAFCLFTESAASGLLIPSDIIPSGSDPPAALAPGVTLDEQTSELIETLPSVVEAQQCSQHCFEVGGARGLAPRVWVAERWSCRRPPARAGPRAADVRIRRGPSLSSAHMSLQPLPCSKRNATGLSFAMRW